jgi:ariadne-1
VKTEKKMEEMQMTTDLTWIEVQFAKKAVEEVLRCRMTLKWTYAMAYYLDKSNAKELFEDNQRCVIIQVASSFIHTCHSSYRDLEKAVEDLSELLESPIEPETIPDLRANMTNKTVRKLTSSPTFVYSPIL